MMEDKVTILMATYNGEKYIKPQIDSIISQTYQNWSLVIADDCSSDSTVNAIKSYVDKYPNKIFLEVNSSNSGGAKYNFINLVKKYCGLSDYYMFADQDDIWEKNKIKNALNAIKKDNNSNKPIVCYSDLKIVDENLNLISSSFYKYLNIPITLSFEQNIIQNNMTGCTMIFNDRMAEEISKLKNANNIIMHDWLISMISGSFGISIFNNKNDILYRQHNSNSVGASKTKVNSFISTGYIKKTKDDYAKQIRTVSIQASEFLSVYKDKLTNKQIQALEAISNIMTISKLKRMFVYFRYNLLKKGPFRLLKQIIFG